jgi:hypothetical protein
LLLVRQFCFQQHRGCLFAGLFYIIQFSAETAASQEAAGFFAYSCFAFLPYYAV